MTRRAKSARPYATVPALTLHGMWPSYSTPVAAAAAAAADAAVALAHRRALREALITGAAAPAGSCFWPQDCTQPPWWYGLPDIARPPRHPPHFEPSLLQVNGILRRVPPNVWYGPT
jgi:hypothetical protein